MGVSSAGQALEDHCTGLDGEAAQLQDCFDEEHALRLSLQVCALLMSLPCSLHKRASLVLTSSAAETLGLHVHLCRH